MSGFSAQTKRDLSEYLNGLRTSIERAITPVLRQVEYLTEAQYKGRAWLLAFGLITGLAFSSIFLWLTQPPRAVERDAQRWRSFTSDLTQEQYDKVTKLLDEIEHQQGMTQPPQAPTPR